MGNLCPGVRDLHGQRRIIGHLMARKEDITAAMQKGLTFRGAIRFSDGIVCPSNG